MGPGEKDAFKSLLDVINKRNQWYDKIIVAVLKHTSLLFLRFVVIITEGGRIS
jgi:hypothetical protein